jgi:hypothetical protein
LSNYFSFSFFLFTAPVFNDLNVERSATVDDGAGTDATVYTINVSDEDETGTLSISILEQTPSEIFMLQDKVLKPKNSIEGDTGETTYKLKFKYVIQFKFQNNVLHDIR